MTTLLTNLSQVYTTHISKYDPTSSKWVPYSGLTDLQLDFTMLDPHIRTALKPVAGEPGTYQLTFRAPDRHGVFKFVIDYKRKGYVFRFSVTIFVYDTHHPPFSFCSDGRTCQAQSPFRSFLLVTTAILASLAQLGRITRVR